MSKSVSRPVSIDEVLENTKYGKFNYFIIIVSGFILLNVVMETLGISFILPIAKCDLNLTYQDRGVLGAVGFFGIITSSHLWGFLADTNGRRRIIAPTLLGGYLASVISSFSPNLITLVVLRYISGFLVSGASATIYAYLGEFHCNSLRNRAVMSAAFVSATTSLVHPIMGWAVINRYWSFYVPILDIVYKPWRFYIVCCGMLGFVSGLCFLVLPESPKFLLSVGREAEAIAILKKIYSINTGNDPDTLEDDDTCIQTLEISTFQHTFAYEFIFVIMFIFMGYFTGKLGRKPALFIVLFICGSCGILCAVVDIPILAIYFMVVFLVCGISASVLSAIIVDIYPTHLRAMAVCICLMMGRIGSVVGTNVVGALIENHCQMVLILSSSLLVLGAFTGFLLPSRTSRC